MEQGNCVTQLNIDIPRDKEDLLDALARAAERSGLAMNDIVLEAIERWVLAYREPAYHVYDLGAETLVRSEFYRDRIG